MLWTTTLRELHSGAGVYRDTQFGRSAEGLISSCLVPVGSTACSANTVWYTYLPNANFAWAMSLDSP